MGAAASVSTPGDDLATFQALKAAYEEKRAGGEVADEEMFAHLKTTFAALAPAEGAAAAAEAPAAETAAAEAPAAVDERHIPFKQIQEGIQEVIAAGKTPLVLDTSEDDKVCTFMGYQACQVIEGKKMVMDKVKGGDVPTILDEARRHVVAAMKTGQSVMVRLGKAATDFKGCFNSAESFPMELFEAGGARAKQDDITNAIFREEDKEQGLICVRDGFHLFVTTQFQPEDYREFLGEMLPLEHFTVLIVDHES